MPVLSLLTILRRVKCQSDWRLALNHGGQRLLHIYVCMLKEIASLPPSCSQACGVWAHARNIYESGRM